MDRPISIYKHNMHGTNCHWALLVAMMLWLLPCLPAMADTHGGTLRPRGDVNADWEASLADVNALADTLISGNGSYNATWSYAADVNSDWEISINDVNALIEVLMGDEEPMPIYSSTLPVLYIVTDDYQPITNREDYVHAEWWLDDMGVAGVEPLGSAEHPLGMQIRCRGNWTWTQDKKPYRLKLESKQPLLGMKRNKHFCLLPHADDRRGLLKDYVGFEVSRRMGLAWAPTEQPVEVVLNGHYWGLYFATEKIRVEPDRVNVIEQKDKEVRQDLITGGWLIELDNYYDHNQVRFTDGDGQRIMFTCQSPDELSDEQRAYFTNLMTNTDAAVFATDTTAWEQYIDPDTLAVFYLVQEVTENFEAFTGSCYMHKQRGDSTKLLFGPVWDFGNSFTRWDSSSVYQHIYENIPCESHWIGKIAQSPRFQQLVRTQWRRYYHDVYPLMDSCMEARVAMLEQAAKYDHVRWPQFYGDNLRKRYEKKYKIPFHAKAAWLNQQWGDGTDAAPDHKQQQSNH